jgi:hypothetical protein
MWSTGYQPVKRHIVETRNWNVVALSEYADGVGANARVAERYAYTPYGEFVVLQGGAGSGELGRTLPTSSVGNPFFLCEKSRMSPFPPFLPEAAQVAPQATPPTCGRDDAGLGVSSAMRGFMAPRGCAVHGARGHLDE